MASNLPLSGVALVAQNAGQFVSTMAGADKALASFGKGAGAMSEIVTGALRRVGEVVTDMAGQAVRAVGSWLKDSVGVAGDFEQTLNVLGATSGATAADLDLVARKAKDLGADMTLPATSAQDAAEVMLELSKAGMTVRESMDAAKGALQLSAAAQVDAATAAQITAGALNAFGLEASEAVRVADLLAAGANASSASMTDLSAGLQQAGFAFNAAGLPIEDLITSLAALTNVGLTGSDSGTALKNALMRLMDPTDKAAGLMKELGFSAYDAQGQMKPLPVLIGDLNTALAGMTDEERNAALGNIFLSDGMKAMIPLLDLGTDGFLKLKGAVTEQGAAADVANAQMQGWNGGIQAIGSQMETLQLVVGTLIKDALTPLLFKVAEFIPKVTAFVERMAALGREVGKSSEPFKFLMSALALMNPGLIGVVGLMLRLHEVVAPIITALLETGGSVSTLMTALTTLLTPLGATEGAITTATQAIIQIWDAVNRVVAILSGEFTGAVGGAQGVLAGVINFVLGTALPTIATLAQWFANNLPLAISTLSNFFNNTLIPALSTAWTWIQTNILPILANLAAAIGGSLPGVIQILVGYWNSMLLPALNMAWSFISTVLIPILSALAGWLADNLPPAVQTVADFLTRTLFPALGKIYDFISANVIPILSTVAQWLISNVPIAIQALTDAWNNTLLPAITTAWNFFKDNILPILKEVANVADAVLGLAVRTLTKDWNEKLKPALDTIWGFFQNNIIPILKDVARVISDTVGPPIKDMMGWVKDVTGGLDGLKSAVGRVVDFLSDMASAIRNMPSLPDVFTPGSPTPAERGFLGVASAIKSMNASIADINLGAMKALGSYIPATGSLPALPVMGGSTTSTITNTTTYQMPIYTNQSPAVLSQGLALIGASL